MIVVHAGINDGDLHTGSIRAQVPCLRSIHVRIRYAGLGRIASGLAGVVQAPLEVEAGIVWNGATLHIAIGIGSGSEPFQGSERLPCRRQCCRISCRKGDDHGARLVEGLANGEAFRKCGLEIACGFAGGELHKQVIANHRLAGNDAGIGIAGPEFLHSEGLIFPRGISAEDDAGLVIVTLVGREVECQTRRIGGRSDIPEVFLLPVGSGRVTRRRLWRRWHDGHTMDGRGRRGKSYRLWRGGSR